MDFVPDRKPKDRPPKGRNAATSGQNTTFNDSMEDSYKTDASDLPETSELNNSSAAVDLAETENYYEADIELQDFKADEISYEVLGEQFIIKARKTSYKEESKEDVYHMQKDADDLNISIPMPSDVDTTKIEASYDGAIYTVRMHKRKQ